MVEWRSMGTRASLGIASVALLLAGQARATPSGGVPVRGTPVALGRNLLTNPGAERVVLGDGGLPGWTIETSSDAASARAERYGHVAGEWARGVAGTARGGQRYFRLTYGGAHTRQSIAQLVDVAALAPAIRSGEATVTISGAVGSEVNEESCELLVATFFDGDGKELGSLSTPPFPGSRLRRPKAGEAALVTVGSSAPLPPATVRIRFELVSRDTAHDEPHAGLADNLSLVIRTAKK